MSRQNNVIDLNDNKKQRAAEQFLEWVKNTFPPGTAEQIMESAGENTLGAENVSEPVSMSWGEKILDAATKILPAYQQYKMQSQIIDLQINRAKRGEPPLNVEQYGAPPVRVQVAPAFTGTLSPTVKTGLWIGAGLFALLLLAPMVKKALR